MAGWLDVSAAVDLVIHSLESDSNRRVVGVLDRIGEGSSHVTDLEMDQKRHPGRVGQAWIVSAGCRTLVLSLRSQPRG